jgi:hypothetical protein
MNPSTAAVRRYEKKRERLEDAMKSLGWRGFLELGAKVNDCITKGNTHFRVEDLIESVVTENGRRQ